MKISTFSRQATVALLVLFTCGISLASETEGAKKRGYATEIDFTDVTKNSIDAVGNVQPLRVFEKDFKHDSYIYGLYGQRLAGTGGTSIEIFPNGKFAVTEWCDICGLPVTLYFGTWHEQDGIVTFDVEQQKPGREADLWRNSYAREYGKFGRFNFFVTAKGLAIGDSILVPEDTMMAAPIDRYFVRKRPYADWEKSLSQAEDGLVAPKSDQ